MIAEAVEFANPELWQAVPGLFARLRNSVEKAAFKSFAHMVMPVINYLNARSFVQHRPDRYRRQFSRIKRLQAIWDRGLRVNNGGDYARLYFLLSNVEALEQRAVPGAFAELGVYKGNSARLMREIAPHRELFLFDTFEGFPQSQTLSDPSGASHGALSCSLGDVRRFVGDHPDLTYCKGTFPETSHMVPEGVRFALVHLDCDLYEPTRAALEYFYPRLNPGGLLVLHDYPHWKGVAKAANEFFEGKPEGLVLIPDKSGSAAMIKSAP